MVSQRRILVVDDELGFGEMVKWNLEASGPYEVKVENHGRSALNAVRTFHPDLIFLDIAMPDLEGSEVARRIKEDRSLKDLPIVFLTGTVTAEEVGPSGGIIGGQYFLAKPVSVTDLISCIQKNTR